MIAYISGKVLDVSEKSLILSASGLGYKLYTTSANIAKAKINENAEFFTYLSVRENALDLYGFGDKNELSFFELLITIPGIGPKSAIGILNVTTIESLRSAIVTGDTGYLTKVSGIGRKTAEKIVLELREKVDNIVAGESSSNKEESDALLALMSLGYNERDSRDALKEIKKTGSSTSDIVKEALKKLGK